MLALLLAALLAQEKDKPAEEVLAITHVRVIPVSGAEIDTATVLVRNGKIAEIGKDVKVPAGATVIEGKGLVAMPGLVNPYAAYSWSKASGSGSTPQNLAYDEFSPAVELLEILPRAGFTTFGIAPNGGIIAGQGLAMKLNGLDKDGMVVSKSAFLRIQMRADSSVKDTIRREFEAAKKHVEADKKYLEDRKKYEEEKKKREEAEKKKKESGAKPDDKAPQDPPLQEPKEPPKPDARVLPLVRALQGELPIVLQCDSPGTAAHFWHVMRDFEGMAPRTAYICPSEAWKAAEEFGKRKAIVLVAPRLEFLPFTRDRVNTAAELTRAGARVAFLGGAGYDAHEETLLFVADLVKHGLPREAALRALTLTPAEALGIEKTSGSLEKDKDADIVLLSGDPFAATARVVRVLVQGRTVYEEVKR